VEFSPTLLLFNTGLLDGRKCTLAWGGATGEAYSPVAGWSGEREPGAGGTGMEETLPDRGRDSEPVGLGEPVMLDLLYKSEALRLEEAVAVPLLMVELPC
jgi:hypothetical protein